MLLIDANILLRCSQGRAMDRVIALNARQVRLATTDRNVEEVVRKLVTVFDWSESDAWDEVEEVLEMIEVVGSDDYDHQRAAADRRLGQGGRSDWPALAAAIALDAEIWSDDRDFFGVGVPVWSTGNEQLVSPDAPSGASNG